MAEKLGFENKGKLISKKVKRDESIMELNFSFGGINQDIISMYHWHINFPYYTGKGYTPLKLEDYHYFSESSQLGQGFRQMKGGSIRAFQENFTQLIQIVRVHLMPLLKEIKQADFYKEWFDAVVLNDEKLREELKKSNPDENKVKQFRSERNEALNHLKEQWVNNVEAGALWRDARPSNEQGVDFALLPTLFFGTNLDNPLHLLHKEGLSIKEQLDGDIYSIDVPLMAKEKVARYMYKFYTWLPSAVKETETTFKIKISALKNIYAQLQLYVSFMKPLLIEISRKSEGFNHKNFYRDFESENPDFLTLFDYSYSFVKILGVRGFQRGGFGISDLEFTENGLYLRTGREINFGKHKGKTGFIYDVEGDKLVFYESSSPDISEEELLQKEKILLNISDLATFCVMEFDFLQKRRNEVIQTQQGPQMAPLMSNKITYNSYVWNVLEIASYRDSLKEENIDLLGSFIEEVNAIKEDLMKYVGKVKNRNSSNLTKKIDSKKESSSSTTSKNNEPNLFTAPFLGIMDLLSPLNPLSSSSSSSAKSSPKSSGVDPASKKDYDLNRISIIEDTWKLYSINKKANGFIQY